MLISEMITGMVEALALHGDGEIFFDGAAIDDNIVGVGVLPDEDQGRMMFVIESSRVIAESLAAAA